jgi:hypothetical protein
MSKHVPKTLHNKLDFRIVFDRKRDMSSQTTGDTPREEDSVHMLRHPREENALFSPRHMTSPRDETDNSIASTDDHLISVVPPPIRHQPSFKLKSHISQYGGTLDEALRCMQNYDISEEQYISASIRAANALAVAFAGDVEDNSDE